MLRVLHRLLNLSAPAACLCCAFPSVLFARGWDLGRAVPLPTVCAGFAHLLRSTRSSGSRVPCFCTAGGQLGHTACSLSFLAQLLFFSAPTPFVESRHNPFLIITLQSAYGSGVGFLVSTQIPVAGTCLLHPSLSSPSHAPPLILPLSSSHLWPHPYNKYCFPKCRDSARTPERTAKHKQDWERDWDKGLFETPQILSRKLEKTRTWCSPNGTRLQRVAVGLCFH